MITTEEFFRLKELWRKTVLKIWNHQCAFSGCIHRPRAYHFMKNMDFLKKFNPFTGIAACSYHKEIVIKLAESLIESNYYFCHFSIIDKRKRGAYWSPFIFISEIKTVSKKILRSKHVRILTN